MLQQSLTIGFSLGHYGEIGIREGTWKRDPVRIIRLPAGTRGQGLRRRRLEERAVLDVPNVLPFVRSGDDQGEAWLATEPAKGPLFVDWQLAVRQDYRMASAPVACHIIARIAKATHQTYRDTEHLPGGVVEDIVWMPGAECRIGSLGELSREPRLPEHNQVAHLIVMLRSVAGELPKSVEATLDGLGVEAGLADLVNTLQELLRSEKSLRIDAKAANTLRDQVEARGPAIAPPSLLEEPSTMIGINRADPSLGLGHAITPGPAGSMRSGTVVGGKYSLVRSLGAGAMGQVFEATSLANGHSFAVKLLRTHGSDEASMEQFAERFRREATALSVLNHPNIVSVHDFGSSGSCWLAMELVTGPSLATRLAALHALELPDALTVARQLCAALGHAHSRGIVHRDVKPANVLVSADQPLMVKLADFGLAKSWDDAEFTADGTLIGTPQYMSPEQCEGKTADAQSDIYSLGVLLFRMISGKVPFESHRGASVLLAHTTIPAPALSAVTNKVFPEVIESVVARCLAKSPDQRYANVAELDDDLALCMARLRNPGLDTPLHRPRPAADDRLATVDTPAEPEPRRKRIPILFVAAIIIGMLLGLPAAYVMFGGTTPSPTQAPQLPASAAPAPTDPVEPTTPQIAEPEAPAAASEPAPASPAARPKPKPRRKRTRPSPKPAPVQPAKTAPPTAAPAPEEPAPEEPAATPAAGNSDLKNPFQRK